MRKVEEIEGQIRQLSREEFAELRQWFLELDWETWDAQIEADTQAGKRTELVSEAKTEYEAGPGRRLLAGLLMAGAWSGAHASGPPIPATVGTVALLVLLAALLAGLAAFVANIILIRRLVPRVPGHSTVFHACATCLAALPWLLLPVVGSSLSDCDSCSMIWMPCALASPLVLVVQWRLLRRTLSRTGEPS